MLKEVTEDADVSIPLAIVNDPTEDELDPDRTANAINSNINTNTVCLFFELLSRERAWTFVLAEKKMSEMFSEEHRQKQVAVEDAACFGNAEIRKVTPIQDGNWFEFPSDTVDTVDERCDVILRLGFGLIRGDILNATEHGVLSFHPRIFVGIEDWDHLRRFSMAVKR
ncbi:methionyl-tRNA formyltransferase-like protein [Halovivax asiaticus JCM 14624]|uniref:Methionyl-tRNA formyltransferase-like protein n=2 Tax=Halovivax asiaticus TaxID=332953 RepID=M0BKZ4_9EURY|nr:methionyl-tRNA formyltransferase-like protein [Halovivax asiaticus JCM 14624]